MLLKKARTIKSSEATPKKLYLSRRDFIARSAALAGVGFLNPKPFGSGAPQPEKKLEIAKKGEFTVAEKVTPFDDATGFTNFYEFSTGKREVKEGSH